ncbi:hypothetical protein BDZ91DRAFT_765655 [Kalaharituber pfeilii]|nr:hypothetical protein BDZ91DRAFT_765655 [Kalaharituber pfeilii]
MTNTCLLFCSSPCIWCTSPVTGEVGNIVTVDNAGGQGGGARRNAKTEFQLKELHFIPGHGFSPSAGVWASGSSRMGFLALEAYYDTIVHSLQKRERRILDAQQKTDAPALHVKAAEGEKVIKKKGPDANEQNRRQKKLRTLEQCRETSQPALSASAEKAGQNICIQTASTTAFRWTGAVRTGGTNVRPNASASSWVREEEKRRLFIAIRNKRSSHHFRAQATQQHYEQQLHAREKSISLKRKVFH